MNLIEFLPFISTNWWFFTIFTFIFNTLFLLSANHNLKFSNSLNCCSHILSNLLWYFPHFLLLLLSPLHIFQIIGILLDFLISSSFFVALCNIFSSRQIVFFYLLFGNRRSILLHRFITFFCRGFSLFFLDRLSIDAMKNRVKKAIIYFQYFWFKIVYDYFAFSDDILNQKAPIFDEVINNHNHIYLYLKLIVFLFNTFSPHFYFNFIAFPPSIRGSFSSIF